MKRVGIITFHRAINYGAVLQAYALQSAIESIGGSVEIIDYRCSYLEDNYSLKKRLKNTNSMRSFVAVLIKSGLPLLKKKKHFQSYLNKKLNLSRSYTSQTIHLSNEQYDLFITGSDQVWNYHHTDFDPVYFLSFVDERKKKASYAASFGFDRIEDSVKTHYRQLLKDFNKVSVREKEGVKIIKDLLGENISVKVSIDPVFLLTSEQWSHKTISKRNYILVYEMMHSEKLMMIATAFSEKYNIPIVRITNSRQVRTNKRIFEVNSCTPEQFIDYIYNAEFVITNSFHGTAFSIIFNKEFYVVPLEDSMASLNARLLNILDLFKLNDRIKALDDGTIRSSVSWGQCNEIIESERCKAMSYLYDLLWSDKS